MPVVKNEGLTQSYIKYIEKIISFSLNHCNFYYIFKDNFNYV